MTKKRWVYCYVCMDCRYKPRHLRREKTTEYDRMYRHFKKCKPKGNAQAFGFGQEQVRVRKKPKKPRNGRNDR